MHLLHVHIPSYRILHDVRLDFERDFVPKVFPLGSLNGGGKSTLLQLLFVLLHCPGHEERHEFLRNMLAHFDHESGQAEVPFATLEIWHEGRTYRLEFLSWSDRKLEEILDGDAGLSLSALTSGASLEQSIADARVNVANLTSLLAELRGQGELDLGVLSKIEHRGIRQALRERGISTRRDASGKLVVSGPHLGSAADYFRGYRASLKEQLDALLPRQEARIGAEQRIRALFEAHRLLYITNYRPRTPTSNDRENALVCRIEGEDPIDTLIMLREIAGRVFLFGPSTQVYLFVPRESIGGLFEQRDAYPKYQEILQTIQITLPGFATLDFFSIGPLVEYFKAARDRDFAEKVESGRYGENYTKALAEINTLLASKRVKPRPDLSGVTFEMDRQDATVTLDPHDLSHGEMKRLAIYASLKSRDITDSLVLMDEIEIALHPDWQYKIVNDLATWSPTNQYILATHSYEVCQAVTPAHVKELEPKLFDAHSEAPDSAEPEVPTSHEARPATS